MPSTKILFLILLSPRSQKALDSELTRHRIDNFDFHCQKKQSWPFRSPLATQRKKVIPGEAASPFLLRRGPVAFGAIGANLRSVLLSGARQNPKTPV
jgi:hypothetical protein